MQSAARLRREERTDSRSDSFYVFSIACSHCIHPCIALHECGNKPPESEDGM
uniref:Uncharacterized protein n=1 Tax=Arundo donax TaxID=35708 RepID=A0A0A9FBR6_ARUDO